MLTKVFENILCARERNGEIAVLFLHLLVAIRRRSVVSHSAAHYYNVLVVALRSDSIVHILSALHGNYLNTSESLYADRT